MNYDFAVMTTVNGDFHAFLENPTEDKNVTLIFSSPPDNQSVYMCLIKRRYEGFLKTEYYDLYIQMGGFFSFHVFIHRTNIYVLSARRKEWGFHTTLLLSIPHDLRNTQHLCGKKAGVDRLSIGMLRSNLFSTSYAAFVNKDVLHCLNEEQCEMDTEVIIRVVSIGRLSFNTN